MYFIKHRTFSSILIVLIVLIINSDRLNLLLYRFIEISPYASSTKVQASIVGNIATISKPETTVEQQPSVSVAHQPRPIAPKNQMQLATRSMTAPTSSVVSSSAHSNTAPMPVIANQSSVLQDMVILPGTNLQISKEVSVRNDKIIFHTLHCEYDFSKILKIFFKNISLSISAF